MFRLRVLPWDYGVRNLMRRPTRSLLTLAALSTVVLLVLVVVGFVRGLEKSLASSGDPAVVLVSAYGSEDSLENSSVAAQTPGLLAASLSQVQRRFGVQAVSPEVYLGTRVAVGQSEKSLLGLVRGVATVAPLVRRSVRLVEGKWPGPGEVMAGRLAAAKLGCRDDELAVGQTVRFEGREWRISGRFVAGGTAFESEIWCPLEELQQATKRQDLSLVALLMAPGASLSEVVLFCKERKDLELQAMRETDYYALLQKHYKPMRMMAWLVVGLVAAAGIFAGLNTMYGAVAGRVRELAALQAIGFRRRAIILTLIQEAVILAATGSLAAAFLGVIFANGMAVRFTMGAFTLSIDSATILIGCGTGLLMGILGAIPPAIRAMRLSIAESLKAV